MSNCSINGCKRVMKCRSFCIIHYNRELKSGNIKRILANHGMYQSREYNSWSGMKRRCSNRNAPYYKNYGGRGIKVCDRWLHSFENFLEDMGERPNETSLDRIDVNGNYEPSNCRWATLAEQSSNTRSNKYITHNGQTLTIAQWGRKLGIKPAKLNYWVLKKNMTLQKAVDYLESK